MRGNRKSWMSAASLTVDHRSRARVERYAARSVLWFSSKIKRVRCCGRVLTGGGAAIKVTESAEGRRAGFAGVQSCGSVWACPVCSAKIAAVRADDMASLLDAWRMRGGQIGLVTLTVRHSLGDSLERVWAAVSAGWRAASNGVAWQAAQDVHGTVMVSRGKERRRIPLIRVVEATVGEQGWHVHVHALVLVNADTSDRAFALLAEGMWGRWDRAAARSGLRSGSIKAMDARLLTGAAGELAISEYLTKAVYELTGASNKSAYGGNMTPFQLLARLVRHRAGEEVLPQDEVRRLERLWAEWERVSRGKRQLTFSHGLRDHLGVEPELTDEEIVEEDLSGEVVALIDSELWSFIVGHGLALQLLEAYERSDFAGDELLAMVRYLASRT